MIDIEVEIMNTYCGNGDKLGNMYFFDIFNRMLDRIYGLICVHCTNVC